MRERAQALVSRAPLSSFVGTFHSWCLRLLRRRAREASLPPRFSIADSSDQMSLVKEAMEELGISTDVLPANAVRSRISQAKNALVGVERFRAEQTDFAGERIGQVYALYEKKLAATGALDFDDLIGKSVRLLSGNAQVAAEERRRVRHLLIDEYQDTNSSQDALVKLLGAEAESLCAVGDEDQSIYRWRGAEIEHILRFEEDFPGARVIALEANYRSTAKILAAASGVVAHNRRRREKKLRADRGDGAAVRLWHFEEDRAEVEAVSREIAGSGRPAGETAILYRTNAQSRPFEEELVRRRIPYVVVGGMKFYERAEVKDVLAYLRLAARPQDDLAFRRVVNVPARGIGAATLDKLAAAVRETGKSLVGGLGPPRRRAGPGADGARALSRHRRGAAREGRDVDPVRAARASAGRHRLRRPLRGLRGPRGRGAPREHPGAPVLGPRVRAAQRRGRDGRRVPRHRRARDERRRRRQRRSRHALHAPRGQGPRVRPGVRRGPRGRLPAARPVGRGRGRARGGAAPPLRRHDAGEGLADRHARRPAARLRPRRAAGGPRASSTRSRSPRSRSAISAARRSRPSPGARSSRRPSRKTRTRRSTTGRSAAEGACAIPATASASSSAKRARARKPG